jgi:hypothetical protein
MKAGNSLIFKVKCLDFRKSTRFSENNYLIRVTSICFPVFTYVFCVNMKSKPYTNSSFFAKMLLLLALVFLAHPDKRKGLEAMLKTYFQKDRVSQVGQIQAAKIAPNPVMPVSLPR